MRNGIFPKNNLVGTGLIKFEQFMNPVIVPGKMKHKILFHRTVHLLSSSILHCRAEWYSAPCTPESTTQFLFGTRLFCFPVYPQTLRITKIRRFLCSDIPVIESFSNWSSHFRTRSIHIYREKQAFFRYQIRFRYTGTVPEFGTWPFSVDKPVKR